MKGKDLALIILSLVVAVGIIGLIINGGITGNAAKANTGKTENTPCARNCTELCTPNAANPAPEAKYLSTSDCLLQCMNARCGQTANAGKCDAFSADGCCNVFATNDPDCRPACIPYGECLISASESCCDSLDRWHNRDCPPLHGVYDDNGVEIGIMCTQYT